MEKWVLPRRSPWRSTSVHCPLLASRSGLWALDCKRTWSTPYHECTNAVRTTGQIRQIRQLEPADPDRPAIAVLGRPAFQVRCEIQGEGGCLLGILTFRVLLYLGRPTLDVVLLVLPLVVLVLLVVLAHKLEPQWKRRKECPAGLMLRAPPCAPPVPPSFAPACQIQLPILERRIQLGKLGGGAACRLLSACRPSRVAVC